MTHFDNDTAPWYKQFWLWFLISIPAVTICYCMLMIYTAISTENSLVSDNYYKDGLAINQELALDNKATELNLSAKVSFDSSGRVALSLNGDLTSPPSFLTLKLLHPTLDGQDIETKLLPEPGSTYSTQFEKPLTGRWYIDIIAQDSTWRLKGEAALPSDTVIQLDSGA
ncbi:FixH family protein [Alkalimarinus alittae]|uniref:FixH family protein n=1 Tax=Alkalimarinus alittae TaxID=2961619 RepID=A0ABY6MXX5_9ALTE|nr:FixH family protein [Alkalimarinus alittae]UZE94650.1 FixH family protein [Alkalimarinus alittae]